MTRREHLRQIGGRFFIAAILVFGSMLLLGGLTNIPLTAHDGPYGCLMVMLSAVLVAISILCWIVSLFL